MAKLSLWKGAGVRTKDYYFFDRIVTEQFDRGGTEFWVHKYIGPQTNINSTADATNNVNVGNSNTNELNIQDVLNMEIRDRNYDTNVYIMKGHHAMSDQEFSMTQFGAYLATDTVFITFPLNRMLTQTAGRAFDNGTCFIAG